MRGPDFRAVYGGLGSGPLCAPAPGVLGRLSLPAQPIDSPKTDHVSAVFITVSRRTDRHQLLGRPPGPGEQ